MEKATDERLIMLGERLKKLRVRHGLTQDDVAFQLSMDRTSISKYEHGVLEPPISVSRKFAKMYNIGLDYLIGNELNLIVLNDGDSTGDDDVLPFAKLTKEEKMLILKMRLMTKEQKEEIENLINNN